MKRKLGILLSIVFVFYSAQVVFAQEGGEEGGGYEAPQESTTAYTPIQKKTKRPKINYEATVAYLEGFFPSQIILRHARVSTSSKVSDNVVLDTAVTGLTIDSSNFGNFSWVVYIKGGGVFSVSPQAAAYIYKVAHDRSASVRSELPLDYSIFTPITVQIEISPQGTIYALVAGNQMTPVIGQQSVIYVLTSNDEGATWSGQQNPLIVMGGAENVFNILMKLNPTKDSMHIVTSIFPALQVGFIEYVVNLSRRSVAPSPIFYPGVRNIPISTFEVGPNHGYMFTRDLDTTIPIHTATGWHTNRVGTLPWVNGIPIKHNRLIDHDSHSQVFSDRNLNVSLMSIEDPVFGSHLVGRTVNLHLSTPGAGAFFYDVPVANEVGKQYSSPSITWKGAHLFSYVENGKNLKVQFRPQGSGSFVMHINSTRDDISNTHIEPIE